MLRSFTFLITLAGALHCGGASALAGQAAAGLLYQQLPLDFSALGCNLNPNDLSGFLDGEEIRNLPVEVAYQICAEMIRQQVENPPPLQK